jgi:integrase/recombinase XerD
MRHQIDSFLNTLQVEKGYSTNTIVAYRNDLDQFVQFLSTKAEVSSWSDVTKEHLVQYVLALKGDHEYASATVARKVAAAKSFFHHLVSCKALSEDPTATLDSPKVRKYSPVAISEDDVARLLQAPSSIDTTRGMRDAALLELLYATGMRVSEVVALDTAHVDIEGGCVHCVGKAGRNKERVIPVYSRAIGALQEYLTNARPRLLNDNSQEAALFVNHRGQRLTRQGLWLIIKKYVDEVGIDSRVTPHTLRHSFATHLLSGGANVRDVQGLLGHANVSTTQVYKQSSQEQVRQMYDEAHPRAR